MEKKMFDPYRVIVLKLIPSVLYYFYNPDFQLSSKTTKKNLDRVWFSFSWLIHFISKQKPLSLNIRKLAIIFFDFCRGIEQNGSLYI